MAIEEIFVQDKQNKVSLLGLDYKNEINKSNNTN